MKPILFNTEMARAILEGRKTVTRRVVKPKYCDSVFEMYKSWLCETSPYKPPVNNSDGTKTCFVRGYVPCKPPCRPGNILYVRETWAPVKTGGDKIEYAYKADNTWIVPKWHPSIHMPREAARIFLRVTDVRVERLQDISSIDIELEGIDLTDLQGLGCITRAEYVDAFQLLWDSTIKSADRALYSWDANPYVWRIEFERIIKEEARDEA